MSTVFENQYHSTKVINAGGAIVYWYKTSSSGSTTGVGAAQAFPFMMLQLTLRYTRSLNPLYPINTTGGGLREQILIAGQPSGEFACQSVITPDLKKFQDFLTEAGAACGTNLPRISVRPFGTSCGDGSKTRAITGVKFYLTGVQLMSLGVGIEGGENALAQMPLQFRFTSLTFSDDVETGEALTNG